MFSFFFVKTDWYLSDELRAEYIFLRRRKETYRLASVIIHIAGIVGFASWITSCPGEAMRARELHPVH